MCQQPERQQGSGKSHRRPGGQHVRGTQQRAGIFQQDVVEQAKRADDAARHGPRRQRLRKKTPCAQMPQRLRVA